MKYFESLYLLEEYELFVIAGTQAGIKKFLSHKLIITVYMREKVRENTRRLVVHVRGTLINVFMKLRQR